MKKALLGLMKITLLITGMVKAFNGDWAQGTFSLLLILILTDAYERQA